MEEQFLKIPHIRTENIVQGNIYSSSKQLQGKAIFFAIYSDRCGHCVKMKPEYIKLAQELNRNDSKVVIAALNSNGLPNEPEQKAALDMMISVLKANGIEFGGFPTFILFRSGKFQEYNGSRDVKGFKQFLNQSRLL
jgi:thiol-disulfide isomerase/thioredoxin